MVWQRLPALFAHMAGARIHLKHAPKPGAAGGACYPPSPNRWLKMETRLTV